jgi:hypothetical protein
MDRLPAISFGNPKFEFGAAAEMVGAQRHAERRKADIDEMPASRNHRLRDKACLAVVGGDDAHAAIRVLLVLGAEREADRHARDRPIVLIGKFEFDLKRNLPRIPDEK